jgi:hypothetical protein
MKVRTAEEDTDVRITPDWLWQPVLTFVGPNRSICDVCTEENNPLGAQRFFTERTNGLTSRWATTLHDLRSTTYWGNVPFSRGQVSKWADKFTREARIGLECLMLTQADVSTDWYESIRLNADARCHLGRRVAFLSPDGKGGYVTAKGGAKFGTQIAYWGPRRRRFHRVFGALGEVIHGLGPQEESKT